MTLGEIMVWAAEFVARRRTGSTGPEAACWAARAVEELHTLTQSTLIDPPAYRMLEWMIGKDAAP